MILYLDTSALVKLGSWWRSGGALRSMRSSQRRSTRELGDRIRRVPVRDRARGQSARAGELASRHLLRGMDALHLASALEVAFAMFDRALALAARAERLTTPLSVDA